MVERREDHLRESGGRLAAVLIAAGLALPLLALAGYAPGTTDPHALSALSLAYGLLPCALKLLAAAGLYLAFIRTPATP